MRRDMGLDVPYNSVHSRPDDGMVSPAIPEVMANPTRINTFACEASFSLFN